MPFSSRVPGGARVLALIFLTTTVLLSVALAASWAWFRHLALTTPLPTPPDPVHETSPEPVSPLLLAYQLDLPGRGEIFPALSSATDRWPIAILTIANHSDRPVWQAVRAQVTPGWANPTEQTLILAPHETRSLPLSPELTPAAYENNEIRRATIQVVVTNADGEVNYARERQVLLHSALDLYWGQRFSNAQYVARWVTPHDAAVLQLVANATHYLPGGRFRGYNAPGGKMSPRAVAQQVRQEARAIFEALRHSGLTYVSSIYTFGDFAGEAQRIRLPSETLGLKNANCIDVSVAFASAIENIGMRPVLVIVPRHAFVGVRLGAQSEDTLYLDLTVLPQGTMEQAVARANTWLRKFSPGRVLTVDVAAARLLKIYPLIAPQAMTPPSPRSPQLAQRTRVDHRFHGSNGSGDR
jgi:hypothetical protein